MSLKGAVKHFHTITRHRHEVIRNCYKAGILWQGLRHDLSKYSPTEFKNGARYYQGHRSPNDKEREEKGYSDAWLHHMGRNKHHFEYWKDYSPVDRLMRPVKMPTRYVAEMFCDRVAASKIYQGKNYTDHHPLTYFENGKFRRGDLIHPETSDLIESMLRMLSEKGEDETFAYIRKLVKEDRKK
ncbi:MAG: catalase [Ruminococcus sp.]|nr:catalase [Ruminococcus sp.]